MSSVPRFFVSPGDFSGWRVTLPPEDAHHARTVLRLRVGESVILLDGTGMLHRATLAEVGPERVVAQVTDSEPCRTEPRTRVIVAQALPRTAEKIEQVLQHGTEIGAAEFIVFVSARTVAHPEEAKLRRRFERWTNIVKAAAQQSGRGVLPQIAWGGSPSSLAAFAHPYDGIGLMLHEGATAGLEDALTALPPEVGPLTIVVGPEGGFTEEEAASFVAAGGVVLSLGLRVLRTETAALVALAQILFARGDTRP